MTDVLRLFSTRPRPAGESVSRPVSPRIRVMTRGLDDDLLSSRWGFGRARALAGILVWWGLAPCGSLNAWVPSQASEIYGAVPCTRIPGLRVPTQGRMQHETAMGHPACI